MINILHISPDFNYSCGVSKYVSLLLDELSKREDLHLFFLTNKGDSLNRLNGVNVKINFLNFEKGNKDLFKFILNYFLLKKFCTENRIEIIHTHHRYPELLAYFVSKFLGIKTITTVHSLVDGWKYFSFKSDNIIAVSKAVERHLIQKYKVNNQKITQMYNFVKPFESPNYEEISNLKEKLGIQEDEKVLLFIGRIGYIKGCDILISAFEKLSNKYPFLRLLMIGNFESGEIKKSVQRNERIIYLSPADDIIKYYYLCDIIVLPSRIDPFPYVMLEAGLAKKPFIGGKTGGIAEFIEDGTNGLLVKPGDVDNLVEKVKQLINDNNLSQMLGFNLFTKVTQLTNGNLYTNKLIELYSSLLNETVR